MGKNDRQLAAVMFTDMVGYTSLMQKDEQKARKDRDRHRKVLEKLIRENKGSILQYFGDGTLSVFDSAIKAVKCAREIQVQLQKEPAIPVRIGLHVGDIVYEKDGVYGDAVNVAARIEAISMSGAVLFSDKVFDDIKNHPEFQAQSLGEFIFKNVKRPVEVFALTDHQLKVPTARDMEGKVPRAIKGAADRTVQKYSLRNIVLGILSAVVIIIGGYFFLEKMKPPGISKEESLTAGVNPSIAVLPFEDISPGQKHGYFCDGMVEELIIALTRVQGLRVVPRTSSFQFKGKNIDVREIGDQFKVKTVLEGKVRIADNKVIITTKLVNILDGDLLWGEKYRGKLEDIYAVQEKIAREIVNALEIKLEKQRVFFIKRYTENIEAYNFFLKGRYFWGRRTPEDLEKGIQSFRKAIELDPDYALAYVGISDSYHLLTSYGVLPPKQAFPKAKEAALMALKIDNTIGEAHNSLAAVKLFYEWDWPAAEREFKRAIELNPYYYTAHEWYAVYLAITNKIEESIAEMKRAAELEPLSISSQTGIGRHLYFAKKFDQSIKQFHRALELNQYCFYAHAYLGQAYIMKSMYPEAITHSEKAVALTGGKEAGSLCVLGYAYAISGKKEKAQKILDQLINLSNYRYIRPTYIAGLCIGLGNNDKAFQWLEKAYRDKCDWVIYLQIEHMFDPIRKDPRFAELVKKLGLEYREIIAPVYSQ